MPNRNREPVSGLDQPLKLLEWIDQPDNEALQKLAAAATATSNTERRRTLTKALATTAIRHQSYPFQNYVPQGDLRLGSTFSDTPLMLDTQNLTKHLLTVGQSGTGKTTLFYNLMQQTSVPFWSFDLKQDYRHLVQYCDDLVVLPWTQLRFNPLKPPEGVSPRRWAQVFSEIFCHATALLSGSKNHLLKKIIELYRLYGLFDWVSEPFPSLHELQRLIEVEKINFVRTSSDYRDRLLNRLEAMNLTAGTVFDCNQGYAIEQLLQRNVVFEFDGLSRDVQNFVMEILFAYVYEYRLAQTQRGNQLRHIFFLDEGKRVFSVYKERQEASGIPEIDELTAKMREFGEGLVVADQEASKLTDSIKANTYTKVLLPTGDQKQFTAITKSMNLSERQRKFASKLDVGEAIIQVGNQNPVPVTLDNYHLEKQVTDEELEKLQADQWSQLSYEPRDPTPEFEQAVLGATEKPVEIPSEPQDSIDLSNKADQLLQDVIENPFQPLTQRYEKFTNSYHGNKAKNELVDQGIVIERELKTLDGRPKLLQLTEKGREYVENTLELDTKRKGRGGIIHQYWQYRVKEAFEEAGWTAAIEKHDADVYACIGDTELAVEVAMGNNPREIEHVEKHLNQGFTVWVICRNENVQDGLQQRLEENVLLSDRVLFRRFRQFIDEQLPRG